DPLERKLFLATAATALPVKADVLVSIAEVNGRRDAATGAAVVLAGLEMAEAQKLVVVGQLGAPLEGPANPAPVAHALERVGDPQRQRVRAVAITGHQQGVARFGILQRGDEQHGRERGPAVAEPTKQGILHLRLGIEAEPASRRGEAAGVWR